ncbi:LysR family transcriptional regulator [Marinicellulosiphila megalodicopiae]|uniref:LysR family transcriptional regulator n=1 Tax=Marinicellulosiphila megalodicopiae TaxID=2724896 RepID=UPI003BB112CF
MRTPTLRQLQIFMALADEKNISKVAQSLHISQPSVSIQLKNLTDLIGLPLYNINARNIDLTDAGKSVLKNAHEMFFSLNKLKIEIEDLKGIKSGTLKLAVVSTAKYFLPILLGEFCKRYPLIDVQLKIGNRQQIIERFNQNKDDFYVFSQCPESENLIAEPFVDNPLIVVAPVGHALTKKKSITLKQLSQFPFLMREQGSGTKRSIDDFCKQHQLVLKTKMTIESNEAIKHCVSAHLGLAILSSHTLDYMEDTSLVRLKVAHFPIKSQWYLVRTKNRGQTVLAELFHDYLQQEGLSTLKEVAVNRNRSTF